MASDRVVRIVIAGDASSGQKALKSIGDSATTAEVKVEGFGKKFLALGAGFGLGAAAAGIATDALREGLSAVIDYNVSIDQSTKLLLGQTKSQEATAAALAVARTEADKGRGTYQELAAAMAGLNTVAQMSGKSLADVTQVAEILAAVNPEEGIKGATFALREAATGDFTSVIERFNLSRTTINKLKAEGVPAIDAVRKAMADLGYDTQFLDTANGSAAKQMDLLKGRLVEVGAEITKGLFNDLAAGVKDTADQLNNAESGLHKLGDAFQAIEDKINGLNGVIAGTGNNIGESIIKGLHAIPNTRSADDPVEQWFQAQIKRYESSGKQIADAAKQSSEKATKAGVDGSKPTPTQIAQVETNGRDILLGLVKGLDSAQGAALDKIGAVFADLFKGADGKADAGKLTEANIALAQALKETANGGQLTSETMYALSAAYQGQTPLVVQLIGAHNALTNAQNRQKDAAQGLADAQRGLEQVQNRAKGDLAGYEAAITSAQQAATAHAQATADALEPLQDALAGVRAAAEASGRDGAQVIAGLQGELEGLQNQASANAAAFQQQIDAAQAKYEAAQTRRQQLQGVLQAALNGEVEAYLRINDIQDESIRKIAEKWQAEIDGQRRAKEGADDKVKGLNRAANKEDLDYLQKIQAARAGGNEKEARRLERELAARQKQRQAAITLAQAEARVAGDNYDAAAEALTKEGKGQDEIEGKAEKAAAAEVTRIQTAAQAQKVADDAAIAAKNEQIKRVQAAQAAEQERYAAQQRGIQAEIDKVNDAAKATAKKDAADLLAAQTLYTQRQAYWNLENTGAQLAVNLFGAFATNTTTIANDSKAAYDQLEKITKLDFQNIIDARAALAAIANQPPPPPPTQNTTPLAPAPQNTPGQTEGQIGPPGAAPGAQGPANMPPLLEGAPGATPPPGYHSEVDNGGNFWFVPNGFSLLNYGKQQGPGANSGNGGDSTSMSAASIGGPSFLRAAGVGGARTNQLRAGDEGGGITVNIHAPNLRDIGSKADQHDLAAIMRRELSSAMRGGLDPGRVGA